MRCERDGGVFIQLCLCYVYLPPAAIIDVLHFHLSMTECMYYNDGCENQDACASILYVRDSDVAVLFVCGHLHRCAGHSSVHDRIYVFKSDRM